MSTTNGMKKDFIWNTIGSGIYALANMVLVFVALHAVGPEDGGIFSFGFSTVGQQMFIIAYFGIRPFHITDAKREYSYNDYRRLRLYTSLIAAGAAALFLALMLALGHYDMRKASMIFALAVYKICDGIADLYESECQRLDKLYIGGIELSIRTILASGALVAVLFATGNILFAAAAGIVLQLICIVVFRQFVTTRLMTGELCELRAEDAPKGGSRTGTLCKNTILIFLSVFVDFYIFAAAKYAIDWHFTNVDSGIFNVLFMPTSLIYLAANFIIKPYMTRMSRVWEEKDYDQFVKAARSLFFCIVIMSLVLIIVTYAIGTPVLGILEQILGASYTGMLTARHIELLMIVFGGCFYAIANLFYYMLIIMREQVYIFGTYVCMAVVAFLVTRKGISIYQLEGAVTAYPIYMLLMAIAFYSTVSKCIKTAREQKAAEEEEKKHNTRGMFGY